MTDLDARRPVADGEISLVGFASTLLRWRRVILALGLGGAGLGIAVGLLSPRVYVSQATFLPQNAEPGLSGVALAATQLGVRLPTSGGGWGATMYVELLRSRMLLEPIARDTLVVPELGGKRIAVADLLEIDAPDKDLRTDFTVQALQRMVKSGEAKALNAVTVTVTSRWPSVSLAIAERLVSGLNRFNVETRRSQAAAERQFAESQARDAEADLRNAEDQLQSFLQQNRMISGSPQLNFQHDRLQRAVSIRQQVYTTLVQSREEARIREVRDTPVITVLEPPRRALQHEPRNSIRKGILGGMAGGALGVLLALLATASAGAWREPSQEKNELLQLVDQATPRFLKRGAR